MYRDGKVFSTTMREYVTSRSPEGLARRQEEICRWLLGNGAVKFGTFGDTHEPFVVHRQYPGEAPAAHVKINASWYKFGENLEMRQFAVEEYKALLREESGEWLQFSAVAGVPSGADGFAEMITQQVSRETGRQIEVVRIEKREGDFYVEPLSESDWGKETVLAEDVMTSGHSSIKAALALHRAGYTVVRVVVLVNREQGGPERLLHLDPPVPTQAVFTLQQILDFYRRTGWLTQEQWEQITQAEAEMREFLQSKE